MRYHFINRTVFVCIAIMALGGCEYLRAVTFSEDEKSGKTENQYSSLYLTKKYSAEPSPNEDLKAVLASCVGEDYGTLNQKNEFGTMTFLGAEGIAVVGGIVIDAALKVGQEKLVSYVDGIKKKGQKTYKASHVLEVPIKKDDDDKIVVDGDGNPVPEDFVLGGQCLVFLRTSEPTKIVKIKDIGNPNFAMVLAVVGTGNDAFRLKPVYLKANNAVAETAEGEPITVSAAFVGKSARKVKGVNSISDFATHTFSFEKVPLGDELGALPDATGLIPQAPSGSTAIELRISITETGSHLPDEDAAKAEVKSLFDAVGPKIKEGVTGLFKEE